MRRIGIAGLSVGLSLVLGACHQTVGPHAPEPGTVPPPPPTECNADGAGWAVGEHATERLAERARMASGAQTVRVMYPDEAYTMEHNPDRLNLEVDDNEVVRQVRCG